MIPPRAWGPGGAFCLFAVFFFGINMAKKGSGPPCNLALDQHQALNVFPENRVSGLCFKLFRKKMVCRNEKTQLVVSESESKRLFAGSGKVASLRCPVMRRISPLGFNLFLRSISVQTSSIGTIFSCPQPPILFSPPSYLYTDVSNWRQHSLMDESWLCERGLGRILDV